LLQIAILRNHWGNSKKHHRTNNHQAFTERNKKTGDRLLSLPQAEALGEGSAASKAPSEPTRAFLIYISPIA